MPVDWVDINVGGETMEAYLATSGSSEPRPAVIVIQEIWGVNSHIQYVTDRLPSLGYVGLAPAMFHRQGRMTMGLHEEFDEAIARMQQCTDGGIVADVQAAVDYLKSQPFVQPDKIGIVGFCFGGRVSYLAACTVSDIAASVVFYGGNIKNVLGGEGSSPFEQTGNITAPMLGLFGAEDGNPTLADVADIDAALTAAGKTHEFHMYPGCGHGFHCNGRGSYRPEAARDAWVKAVAWFDQHLKE